MKPYQVPDNVEITCPLQNVTLTPAQSLSLADTYKGYVMEFFKEANTLIEFSSEYQKPTTPWFWKKRAEKGNIVERKHYARLGFSVQSGSKWEISPLSGYSIRSHLTL